MSSKANRFPLTLEPEESEPAHPTVSVIVPTFNRANLVCHALASVLRQTYAPLEILVVDDGSTDNTCDLVKPLGDPVRYFFQSNRGPAAARNVGIQSARGEMLAFLDTDDLWVPEALQWRVERFQNADLPPVGVVLGLIRRLPLGSAATNESASPPRKMNLFGSALVRREVFEQVGLLDEELRYGEDIDWFMRLGERGVPFDFLEQVTLLYQSHPDALMNDTPTARMYLLRALKKSLARRSTGEMQKQF